jgi:uncharacterized membrane-anchored protein
MNPKLVFALFIAVAVVQLATPIGQIWKYEDTLRTGRVYKFRTAPVDPYDAFRGKYVALNYAGTVTAIREGDQIRPRGLAYVALSQDENGFALFGELSADPPPSGDYLRVECQFSTFDNKAHFRLPFDRFFMEESKAPKAEQAYRRYGNRQGQTIGQAYVMVRVKSGRGVIEDLFVKDQSIREFITKEMP